MDRIFPFSCVRYMQRKKPSGHRERKNIGDKLHAGVYCLTVETIINKLCCGGCAQNNTLWHMRFLNACALMRTLVV